MNERYDSMWKKNPNETLIYIFKERDCKLHMEKNLDGLKWLLDEHPQVFLQNMDQIPIIGTWKDLLILLCNHEFQDKMLTMFADQLEKDKKNLDLGKPVSICAKYAPSIGCTFDKHAEGYKPSTILAIKLFGNDLIHSTRQAVYRKYLKELRDKIGIVETKLCEKTLNAADVKNMPMTAKRHYKSLRKKYPMAFRSGYRRSGKFGHYNRDNSYSKLKLPEKISSIELNE